MRIRTALYVALAVSLSSSVWAQTPQTPRLTLSGRPVLPEPRVFARPFKITFLTLNTKRILVAYDRAEGKEHQLRMVGRVGFTLDGLRITADEADVDTRSSTINLGGNVTLKVGAQEDGSQYRLTGGVRFALGDALITADEADMDTRRGTINLRGNVTLKIR